MKTRFLLLLFLSPFLISPISCSAYSNENPVLGSERVVFQTSMGDIEFGFYHNIAPITCAHILKLAKLGAYNTNHFFRVDSGFVAQVADVINGRLVKLNQDQFKEGEKKVIGEFSKVQHVRGILSMGRYSDPDSAGSSFSILLGDAPHLDKQYAIFGKMTKGDETLTLFENLPTKREGIFVMPLERITIHSTYVYDINDSIFSPCQLCQEELFRLKQKIVISEREIQDVRSKCLP